MNTTSDREATNGQEAFNINTTSDQQETEIHQGTESQERVNSQETTHVQETTDVQATTNVQEGMSVQEATDAQETTDVQAATNVQGGMNDQEPADVQETTDVEESTNTPEAMDVQEATNDQEGTVLHSLCGRTVVRLGDNLVVKSGHLRPQEGEALRFIAANTTIPVPKVHDIRWKDGKVVALVMDYIPGKRLDEAWKTLDSSQKLSIAKELRSYMNQLRELKGDYIGAVGRGKAISRNISCIEGGPFDTEQEFNEFILGDIVDIAPDVLRHYAKFALMDNHEIVFTHSDFAPRNILVEDGRVTGIIDWEYAGWYPAYWEYYLALRHLRPMYDWPEYMAIILPPKFEREYIGMNFLSRMLSH
ncbi:uncharacterized protein N7518_004961 [Penicillium psychrosexuale]|uniref:uncharacterized protein n=1 Tax=Penicillium psychrosexuale TaxID=1002107 RepID=UPI0025450820|nr:uncharacterized protein N7518_004961 [Penicillium psychrosexuale]KAJ5796421.1 hypothetical protein N7518_004961 [Penicillium psychrosexuale]